MHPECKVLEPFACHRYAKRQQILLTLELECFVYELSDDTPQVEAG
jgi:hypothetical protein